MDRNLFISEISHLQESLRRFLLVLCHGDRFTADDIAQDACLKAWISIDRFRGESSLSTWLFRIAYRCWCDRKYSGAEFSTETSEAVSVPDSASAEDKFRYQELYQAIGDLSPNEKASVLLFYMEDRSIKEISAIMGIPEGTVKSLLSRGRVKLKEKLGKE